MKTRHKKGGIESGGGVSAALMMFPALFLLVVTSIYPFLWMFRYICSDYNGFVSYFTGPQNFIRMMNGRLFWQSVVHTFEYAFLKILFVMPLALVLAVLLGQKILGSGFFRAVYFMPTIISSAVYSLIFGFIYAVFNGSLNAILSAMGLISAPVDWLGNPDIVMLSIVIVAVWGGLGNYMILLMSGISSISVDIYESSKLDGANGIQTFFRITLPMLSPILKVVLMLAITTAFKDYQSIMVLTNGGPNNRSQVMFSYIYQVVFGTNAVIPQIGYGTMLSVVSALIIGVVTAIYLFISRKLDDVV